MHNIHPDRPLTAIALQILSSINQVLANESAEYFVVGATARDILLYHVFGIEMGRATRDVDFAVAVKD